jgi:hypothetical protein
VITFVVACALASGCFNHRGSKTTSTESYLSSSSQYLPDGSTNGLYLCPTSPNVVPSYDRRLDGSGFFRVCRHRTSTADIKIHGHAYSNAGICVFPIQYVDATHIYAKPDVRTGAPWSQCYPLPSGDSQHLEETGVYGNFPSISWNAAVIVDPADNVTMRTCLALGQLSRCPEYSLGKFRD